MNGKGYEFKVCDRSLLLPYYARWLWDPLTGALPRSLSPNSITLASNVGSGLAYWLLLSMPHGGAGVMAAVAIANFVYFTLDNVDGRQARRTGTCSSLGEFLDHWFDAWNLGMLVLSIGLFFEIHAVVLLPAMIACSLGFFMTYWEQYRTGSVQLGYVGANEGLTAVSLLFALAAFVGKAPLVEPLLVGLSVADVFCVLMAVGFLGVAISAGWRNSAAAGAVLGATAGHLIVVAWFRLGSLSLAAAVALMVLWHVVYTGRVLACRLLARSFRALDGRALTALVGGCLFANWSPNVEAHLLAAVATSALLVALVAGDGLSTIQALRKPAHAGTLSEAT